MVSIDIRRQLEIFSLGTVEVIGEEELKGKLKLNRPLTVKAGFDPTAPDIHLGHTVLIHKMRQFQEQGHNVVFLIGDFTAAIGDPSGKSETRPPLSREQILENAKTYQSQVFKILDPALTKVVFNSEWFDKFSAADMIKLASRHTVARMLERDDFHKRYTEQRPIAIHEFLYPLIQGYDSVALKADVEIGGTDQKFNLLVGRELQKAEGQSPQAVITMPLLEGTDGVNKMSKSLGNYIGVDEKPGDIVGKIMSISDELMVRYYELVGGLTPEEFKAIKEKLSGGDLHPREAKMELAKRIVERFYDSITAESAGADFDSQFREKKVPDDMETFTHQWEGEKEPLSIILAKTGAVKSSSEARRLIKQGGLAVDGEKISDETFSISPGEYVIKLGKKRYVKLTN
ncbi:MAG: tyrosine--tRNA ligase [Nitrospinota bacterium]|nr:tyrosine--tRNA ligase [Nitrospinota bacterium]